MRHVIEYSSAELQKSLEKALDEMNTFRYNSEYRFALGDSFMEKFFSWEKNISYCKENPFTIAVVGDFKRGKSTLINALLGEEVVTTDVTTETVTLNRISYGIHSNEAVLKDNRRVRLSDNELKREKLETVMDEIGEPIQRLELKRPCELLKKAVIIDTPGTGDAMEDFSDVVKESLLQADAVIYVYNVQYPLSKSEQIFLKAAILPQKYTTLFMVGNYSDILGTTENYTKMQSMIKERVNALLPNANPYMVSALDELCKELNETYQENELTPVLRSCFDDLRESLNELIEMRADSVVLDRLQRLASSMIQELEIELDAIADGLKMDQNNIDALLQEARNEEINCIQHKTGLLKSISEIVFKMKTEANAWMGEFIQRIVDETANLNHMSNDDLKRYYEFYCIDLLQEALDTCVGFHEDKLLDILDSEAEGISNNLTEEFRSKQVYNFRINLDNRIWTKGDTVGLITSQIASANCLTYIASMIADGITGSMREKEKQASLPDLIEQISKKLLNMSSEVSKTIDTIYDELCDKAQKLLVDFYEEQIVKRKHLLEQTIQAANKGTEEKRVVEDVVESARLVLNRVKRELLCKQE